MGWSQPAVQRQTVKTADFTCNILFMILTSLVEHGKVRLSDLVIMISLHETINICIMFARISQLDHHPSYRHESFGPLSDVDATF